MNKKLGHNLAGKLFNLSRRGGSFSRAQFRAAERLYKGTGTDADLQTVRQALGIKQSGASDAKKQLRGIKSALNTFSALGQAYDQMARGNVMTGIAGMLSTGMELGNEVMTSKWLKNKMEDTAQKMLGDASRGAKAFYALGRFARVGSGVAMAATAGWEIGSAIRESYDRRKEAEVTNQGLGGDMMRKHNLDAGTTRTHALATRRAIRASNKVYGAIEDITGLDMGLQTEETAMRQRMAKLTDGIISAIERGDIQVNNRGAIAEILADDTLGPAARQRKLAEYTNTHWDPAMAQEKYKDRINTEAALRRSMMGDWFGTGRLSEQERMKITMELQEKELRQIDLRKDALRRAAADWDERLNTPEQRRFRDETADVVNSYWGERRRSHQAQAVD